MGAARINACRTLRVDLVAGSVRRLNDVGAEDKTFVSGEIVVDAETGLQRERGAVRLHLQTSDRTSDNECIRLTDETFSCV